MRIFMLPAEHGDCLVIEYESDDKTHVVLIDAGTTGTCKRLVTFLGERYGMATPRKLALMVVTHIDDDHIGGVLPLLKNHANLISPAEIWFNGYRHLPSDEDLGAAQGAALEKQIEALEYRWNETFAKRPRSAVMIGDRGPLPRVALVGGATITLLSPNALKLSKLRKSWEATLKGGLGLASIDTQYESKIQQLGTTRARPRIQDGADLEAIASSALREDTAPANGSSIAFLLEHGGKRVLFGADAHPSVLASSLRRLQPSGRIELDAFKLAHHGSTNNTSQELLEMISCPTYLVSSNGAKFHHPDPEAIARVIVHHDRRRGAAELHFNYDTEWNDSWKNTTLMKRYGYATSYREESESSFHEIIL